MDVAEIEKALGDVIVDAADQVAAAVCVKPLGAAVLDTMQPCLHDVAEAFVAAAEAGDTQERFAARMAALDAEKP